MCKEPRNDIEIYLIDLKDFVFEGDTIVRKKRKYGKYKRTVHKLTPSKEAQL